MDQLDVYEKHNFEKKYSKNILQGNYGHFCELVEMTKKIELSKF